MFGVRYPIMPRLKWLMFQMPMSSPQRIRIFGFFAAMNSSFRLKLEPGHLQPSRRGHRHAIPRLHGVRDRRRGPVRTLVDSGCRQPRPSAAVRCPFRMQCQHTRCLSRSTRAGMDDSSDCACGAKLDLGPMASVDAPSTRACGLRKSQRGPLACGCSPARAMRSTIPRTITYGTIARITATTIASPG